MLRLSPQAIVVADNIISHDMGDYVAHVRAVATPSRSHCPSARASRSRASENSCLGPLVPRFVDAERPPPGRVSLASLPQRSSWIRPHFTPHRSISSTKDSMSSQVK